MVSKSLEGYKEGEIKGTVKAGTCASTREYTEHYVWYRGSNKCKSSLQLKSNIVVDAVAVISRDKDRNHENMVSQAKRRRCIEDGAKATESRARCAAMTVHRVICLWRSNILWVLRVQHHF